MLLPQRGPFEREVAVRLCRGCNESEAASLHASDLALRDSRIDEEIKELNEAKREIYAEAKSNGFDVKVLREVIRIRNALMHWPECTSFSAVVLTGSKP
jgi:Uncharacterized protein conserved in bacteria (DUF2312)